jgi:probable rRNA maturation factor
MGIFFHTLDVNPGLKRKTALKRWIKDCILAENKTPGDINIIFCSDEHLLEMNRTHLNHDYYTDIITFDFTVLDCVSGDLYISHDRLKENSMTNKVTLANETYRVIIHGVMHLCGYKDKTKTDIAIMRSKEEKYLDKLSF